MLIYGDGVISLVFQAMSFAARNKAPYQASLMPQTYFIREKTRTLFTTAR